jgi:hypothetical protein
MANKKQSMTAKNKAFWKLSKGEQRVAVAKDVLKQLANKFYTATTGDYLVFSKVKNSIESLPPKMDALFSDLKTQGASCKVCGIGSVFASMVTLGDNLTCDEAELPEVVYNGHSMDDEMMRKAMNKVFPEKQRILIESAFEKSDVGFKNEGDNWTIVEVPDYVNTAINFGKKHRSARSRLTAIMENIIKNKGEFIP